MTREDLVGQTDCCSERCVPCVLVTEKGYLPYPTPVSGALGNAAVSL